MRTIIFRLSNLILFFLLLQTSVEAASLTIPANCALNINSCSVNVPGDVSNAGTLQTSTGSISLTGNWVNSGTFTSGTGTVVFNGTSGLQTLDTGGVAQAFYNLTHSGASTLRIITNLVDVNNNFTNSSGVFETNNFNVTVGKDWNNTSTFTPGLGTIIFDGTNQQILGTSTFYNFTKQVSSADTITFADSTASPSGQTITNYLTLIGATGNLLSIRSTINGTQSKLNLQAGAAQAITNVNVKDSNATGNVLFARGASVDAGNNNNWVFAAATLTWTGADAHAGADQNDWDNPFNWDLGLVPAAGDTVTIPAGPTHQPVLTTAVNVANLTVQSGATLTLNGKDLTVTAAFSNDGNVKAIGSETITLTQDTDSGTWTFVGDANGTSNNRVLTINGTSILTFYNLVINDPNATAANRDTYTTNGALTANNNLTVTSGALTTSTNSNAVVVGGSLTVNGGDYTATNSTIDVNGSVVISSGTFVAPSGTTNTTFTVAGNWTKSGGVFTNSSGKVTFDGTGQSINGSTDFYQLRKVVAAADTLTLDATGNQTVANNIVLTGATGQLLSIRSSVVGTKAGLRLTAGTQNLDYLDVRDADACQGDNTPCTSGTGLLLVARHSVDSGNNDHWNFTGTTITWTGTTSTDWDTNTNWNLGIVPTDNDTAVIANVANQPILATNVTLTGLTLNASTILRLNGKDLTVSGTFSNNGDVKLFGSENLSLTQDTDSGTWTYIGNGDGTIDTRTIKDFGATDYYHLVINDANATKDVYQTHGTLTVNGDLTVTSATFDTSTNSNTVVINGAATVNGGTWTATNSIIDANGNFTISSGVLTAPSGVTNTTFTVAGNWAHSGGTFTNSSGKVTFDGTNQAISGDTTFYQLRKVVTAADTFTLTAGTNQTVTNNLTMTGASGQLLSLRSSVNGTQANITLSASGLQVIQYVDVKDNNASGGLRLVGRDAAPASSSQNNTNWSFGAATLTWTGATSIDWDVASNWDLGVAPISGDTAIITNVATQPTLSTNVSLVDLTLQASTVVTLAGKNLTVTGVFSNDGNVKLQGNETIALTQDTDSGTWTYVGNADGVSDTRTIKDFGTTDYYNLVINDPNATKDVFSAVAQDMDINNDLTITAGTFVAPGSAKTFTLGGSFTNAGTFTHSSGTVTFDTPGTTTVITGNTTFYNFNSTAGGKTFQFANGSTQTVNNIIDFSGQTGSPIIMTSQTNGTKWTINFPNGDQNVNLIDVRDSDANNHNITCYNCTNSGNNNARWVFATLTIDYPQAGKTISVTPTLVGRALPGGTVAIRRIVNDNSSDPIVATTVADSSGNYMVTLGVDDDSSPAVVAETVLSVGTNGLRPWINTTGGSQTNGLVVSASPTSSQVPVITSPASLEKVRTATPTIVGSALASQSVLIKAKDKLGNLLLSDVGTGAVDGSGNYSVTLSSSLYHGYNYLSVIVDGVASSVLTISLVDPYGVVFDSSSSQVIKNATVKLFRASDNQLAVPGVDIDSGDTNPYVTGADGLYSFLAVSGNYYMTVAVDSYNYPSTLTTFPSGRAVTTGSKGETFTVGTVALNIDHPVDGNGFLLRLEKDANKSEVRVGDVITYSIKIKNLSVDNTVNNFLIEDKIPPGFKYLSNRVLLDGVPLAEPAGDRPLVFSIPTIAPGIERTLKYQLVVGSGVTQGKYENVAIARYSTGVVISNRTSKTVRVIMDPLFDMGTVIGKVFWDLNENGHQDAPEYDATERETIIEKPVSNVQIVTEDGAIITTDREGKFSLNGILPGRHIFRVDERTLPEGAFLTTDKAVIVDITQGSMVKVNFGVNMDNTQVVGRDAQFFNDKIAVTQDRNRPTPRLHAAMFGEGIPVYQGLFIRPVEFRLFSNYTPFIDQWQLNIIDQDTKRLIKRFAGNRFEFNDPIFWNGRDQEDRVIRSDRNYAYQLVVMNNKGQKDNTVEKSIALKVINDEESYKKEKDPDKEAVKLKAEQYAKWVDQSATENSLDQQLIAIEGETLRINRQGQDIKMVRVLKNGELYAEVPVTRAYGLTPQELLVGGLPREKQQDNLEVVLPSGDYTVEVISPTDTNAPELKSPQGGVGSVPVVPSLSPVGQPIQGQPLVSNGSGLQRYSRKLKVGDDYFMFVALGDAKVGYNFNRGNMEPVAVNDKFQNGFWQEGKAAYYLKGKIKGKYLVTSSFDTQREQKALFRELDPNTYYPIYGDNSSVNYDATNTKGPLFLLVEWDKSQAIWGNYAVDFKDTEFAAFSRNYYGGKIDYQSVANNPYGDPRTKVVVFHAEVQQKPAHNEMLATGGSLFFLKNKRVVEGSEKISIEVRDKFTGLPIKTMPLKNGADYELDNDQGRILFWQPVSMVAKDLSIISSSDLANGNPIYIMADYQYEVTDKLINSSEGGRVAQAVGKNVVVGATLVKETQADRDYNLRGVDTLVHVGENTNIKVEAAATEAVGDKANISTDGGITYTNVTTGNTEEGLAYGITGDSRLFDRLGLTSYYKWIDNTFAGPSTSSQQGKELSGLALTFDMTPVTRLTVRRDIQKLINSGNFQTQVQVGGSETTVTMAQITHDANRLRLTGEYQLTQVKSKLDDIESNTNQEVAAVAGKAEYDMTDKVTVSLTQQVDVKDKNKNVTTVGVDARVTDKLAVRASEAFSKDQQATTIGATTQVTPQTAITTDVSVAQGSSGEVATTKTVGIQQKVNDQLTATSQVSLTDSTTQGQTSSAVVGAKAKVNETTDIETTVGKATNSAGQSRNTVALGATSQVDQQTSLKTTLTVDGSTVASTSPTGGSTTTTNLASTMPTSTPLIANQNASNTPTQVANEGIDKSTSMTVEATRKIDEKTEATSSVKVDENALGGKTTTLAFGNKNKLTDEVQAVTERAFNITDGGTKSDNKYALVREKDGRKLEGSLTRSNADETGNVSQSNIFGLTGDVNDRWALQANVEKGKVQNLGHRQDKPDSDPSQIGPSQTDRLAFSVGSGYVFKDVETNTERFKNSTKFELRLDSSVENHRQYVFYNAAEGKVTDNLSMSAKLEYGNTFNTTTNVTEARHKEIILGTAYRPVNFDNLNFIAQYTFKENQGPMGQSDAQSIEQNRMQVLAAEGIYDVDEKWQIAEKVAYRINEEKVSGFEFNKTHTWLMIHRLNYRIDRNWIVGGEYRKLTQVEAKDSKQGFLLEAIRRINDNAELAVGWNFSKFSDDLTKLNYTSQGPYLRMSGKLYDRSPEEKARDRAKWLDNRVTAWAWAMVKKELISTNSKVVSELSRMFELANQAQKEGRLEESKQMFKDIITAGQMMFDEASEYIRRQIAYEESLQKYNKTAADYYKGGDFIKARKIWEKIVEDASKRVLQ